MFLQKWVWVPKTSGQLAMLATLKLKQSFENDRIQILFYQATGIPHLITSSLQLHNLILQRSSYLPWQVHKKCIHYTQQNIAVHNNAAQTPKNGVEKKTHPTLELGNLNPYCLAALHKSNGNSIV